MSQSKSSLHQMSPSFIISTGTQVVLKASKAVPGGPEYWKPGTVGIIVESPPSNDGPYVIQFADGQTVKAYFSELALRREEIDHALGEVTEDLESFIIYRCQVGSKAYGLANEASDDDLRGIYLPTARLHWSLHGLPEQLEFTDDGRDEVYWELEKYVRLALKANPTVLETLWTPLVLNADETAQELRAIRRAFLSRHVYKTYSGYVLSQFRRMTNAFKNKGTYKTKQAMHLIRLLYSGIEALRTGEILVYVIDRRDELLSIRDGQRSFGEVKQKALDLDKEFRLAFDETSLPEQPDFAQVNDFLIRARRRMVDD